MVLNNTAVGAVSDDVIRTGGSLRKSKDKRERAYCLSAARTEHGPHGGRLLS